MENTVEKRTVSTIITTYYRNDFLQDAIESVLDQSYEQIEIIVVDDSGERHAESIVDEYSDIIYVPLKNNKGTHVARATGFKQSTGHYVQYLDDDDTYTTYKTEKQINIFEKNDVGVVYCGTNHINDGKGIKLPGNYPNKAPGLKGNLFPEALDNSLLYPCTPSTMMINSDILGELMPLRHLNSLSAANGHAFIIELAKKTNFDYIDEPLTIRRSHEGEITSNELVLGESMIKLVEMYSDIYNEYPSFKEEYISRAYRLTGQGYINRNIVSPTASWYFLKRAISTGNIAHFALFLSSLFGRPGVTTAQTLYNKIQIYK